MMQEVHSNGRKSKLRKVGNQEKEDRISNLPDSILCHILSFLPTNYAAATCILSSRWKHVWISYPNLCFDDRLCSDNIRLPSLSIKNSPLIKFEKFVDNVFFQCEWVNINKFSLHCYKLNNLWRLRFWVSSAIMRNVREIELNIEGHDCVELPECIFTSKTLEVVKLNSDFIIKIPPSGICFPSVKILHVKMFYPDNDMTKKLFTICPVLEDLSINAYLNNYNLVTNLNISSSTLKRLTLELRKDDFRYIAHHVMIKAPNLQHLYIKDYTPVSYVVHDHAHVAHDHALKVCADITSVLTKGHNPAHCIVQLLEGISNAKFLSLSKGTMSALDCAFEDCIPTFLSLTCLEVEVGMFGWRLLPIILHSAPNLQALVFVKAPNVEAFVFEKDAGVTAKSRWIEQRRVPPCLLFHVKKIDIRGFEGRKEELKLIKYLLKNGKALNTMIVRFQKTWFQEKLSQKLLMFERGSKTCQVEVL